jgi:methylated-DNA-[protein]-cysteine S-methyltransferase
MIQIHTFESPIGALTAALRTSLAEADAADGGGRVCLLHFGADGPEIDAMFERWYPGEPRARRRLRSVEAVLDRYFQGELAALDDVAVELNGTPFQKQVWQALRRIPSGTTISYAELARRIGNPSAIRAVGTANGANPVAVIVPCHRVIGSDGSLTGYGGGLERKQWLLAHEGLQPLKLF